MIKTEYPFVYIGSLMRTGSTVMQECLTKVPFSFIFCEPKFGQKIFKIDPKFLTDLPFNVRLYLKPPSVEMLAKKLMPKLKGKIAQVGVKEIKNNGWRDYLKYFSDVRFVLTGRNPRDIYLSVNDWVALRNPHAWKRGGILIPELLFSAVNMDFIRQKQMFKAGKAMRVKYEEFCKDPDTILSNVKEFVKSPIPNIGEIGGYTSVNPKRGAEYRRHGKKITSLRINRWKKEPDKQLVLRAEKFANLMSDYCNFWGY